MESLSETIWDVVISGTGLPQALLALSLSRSGKKILHVDKNRYYGGDDAAFTLQEAEQWVEGVGAGQNFLFSDARIISPAAEDSSELHHRDPSSRAYSLTITPQITYAKSKFLQTLVSSQIHTQLEFLAVGSWWTCTNGSLRKIPASREDVFADDALSVREKRALMKLLRYLMQGLETEEPEPELHEEESLQLALSSKFGVPPPLQAPLLALSLSPEPSSSTDFNFAMARIKRHMHSVGIFGAGFGAVIPKYGGNAEIAQVACRACAVGGGIYVLGEGVKTLITSPSETNSSESESADREMIQLELSGGEKVRARRVVGSIDDLPEGNVPNGASQLLQESLHSISIVSDPLAHIFPPIAENGPPSAVAIVLAEERTDDQANGVDHAPVYLQIHSDETGECPRGQCIIYGSTLRTDENSRERLEAAVNRLLRTGSTDQAPEVLWSMWYASKHRRLQAEPSAPFVHGHSGRVLAFLPRNRDLAFDDRVLDSVKAVWREIMGEEVDDVAFMRFEEREQNVDDD